MNQKIERIKILTPVTRTRYYRSPCWLKFAPAHVCMYNCLWRGQGEEGEEVYQWWGQGRYVNEKNWIRGGGGGVNN